MILKGKISNKTNVSISKYHRESKYSKSNENSKRIKDYRLRWIQIPCGHCEECRRAKANEWRVRLMEEIKSNSKNIIFATLTFSEESLKKLEYGAKILLKTPTKSSYKHHLSYEFTKKEQLS